MKKKIIITSRRGVALYIAMLVTSLVLAIGLSMANIFLKEFILSSTVRESQIAFYSADSGIECATYWDTNPATPGGSMFASTSPTGQPLAGPIFCANKSINLVKTFVRTLYSPPNQSDCGNSSNCDSRTSFQILLSEIQAGPCAEVTVDKFSVRNNPTNFTSGFHFQTRTESRGYNTCDPNSQKRVERAIRLE